MPDVTLQFSQAEKMYEEPEGCGQELWDPGEEEGRWKVEEVEVEEEVEEVVEEERDEERWRAGAGG